MFSAGTLADGEEYAPGSEIPPGLPIIDSTSRWQNGVMGWNDTKMDVTVRGGSNDDSGNWLATGNSGGECSIQGFHLKYYKPPYGDS